VNFVEFTAEDDFVEFRHHLARAKAAQVAALTARRAAGVLLGHVREVTAVFDLLFQCVALLFTAYQNMTGAGTCHNELLNKKPNTVGQFITPLSCNASPTRVNWATVSAATLLSIAPLLVAFLLFQRQFVQSFLRAGIR